MDHLSFAFYLHHATTEVRRELLACGPEQGRLGPSAPAAPTPRTVPTARRFVGTALIRLGRGIQGTGGPAAATSAMRGG